MIITSIDPVEIKSYAKSYISEVSATYFEIRKSWARNWYVFDSPEDVERTIYYLIDRCCETPTGNTIETTGIKVRVQRAIFTEDARVHYDSKYPKHSRAANGKGLQDYTSLDITFTLSDRTK